jgi:hypothetical protein
VLGYEPVLERRCIRGEAKEMTKVAGVKKEWGGSLFLRAWVEGMKPPGP